MQPSKVAILLVTFLSLQAWGAPPTDPSPTPTPTPPPKCGGRNFSFKPLGQTKVFYFYAPTTEAGQVFPYNCAGISGTGDSRWKGTVQVRCDDDGDWQSPVSGCAEEKPELDCRLQVSYGVSKNELEAAYKSVNQGLEGRSIMGSIPSGGASQGNIAKVTASCGSHWPDGSAAASQNRFVYQSALPSCKTASSGLCYLDPYEGIRNESTTLTNQNSYAFQTNGPLAPLRNGTTPRKESVVYLWNKGKGNITISNMDLRLKTAAYGDGDWSEVQFKSVDGGTQVGGVATEATSCELKVSGAVSEYSNTTPPSVLVESDVLVFSVNLKGGVGVGPMKPTVTFSGGPEPSTGIWTNPPTDGSAEVTAHVETATSKDKFSCKLKINTRGKAETVMIRRFGDCSYFNALRTHYFHDISSDGKMTKRSAPYNPTMAMAGIDAQYGKNTPEVPFAGVLNVASATSGEIALDSNGKVILPPPEKRAYSKAVIVAKRFQSGNQVQDPLFYGVMDPNDYTRTRISQIDPGMKLNDDDMVVFQAFIAATQPNANMVDIRGRDGGIPYYAFTASTSAGLPYDRLVPFTNESCIPLFQSKPPLRKEIAKPSSALTNVTQCMYSRPYKVSDIRLGRVEISLMHLVPTHADQQFPTQLLKASSQPPCVASNPTDQGKCWDMKAASLGISASTDPFKSHEECRTVTTTWQTVNTVTKGKVCTTQSSGGNGGGTYQVCQDVSTSSSSRIPITTVTYKPSCQILEQESECTANVALRFSGFNQMQVAALMCAAQENRPNELVSATLPGQGIIPYTPALGGSNPLSHEAYPQNAGGKGVGCIPCRFANDHGGNENFTASVGTLPVDQDRSSARSPVFSFKQMNAPKECIRNISFEVRYFGSSACTGVNNPPGHFCNSSNLGGQSCGASDGKGSGNVAGRMTIPICPNSGFEYDNVSVSWSPMILDLGGNGIQISRDAEYALQFDIRGDGKQRYIDWPMNTSESAFLVMPNKDGKVVSGRELFGEYKAKNGFDALAKLDSNKDKKIDRDDKDFAKLKLWFDRNRNAIQEDGELATLESRGVETIYLQHRKITNRGTDGRTLSSVYYNSVFKEYLNVADYYFNEYPVPGAKKKGK